MVLRSNRLAVIALCVLPALGVDPRIPGTGPVGSFFFACPGAGAAPTVRTRYTAAGKPKRRPSSSYVEVYETIKWPPRPYERLGEIEVLSRSPGTSVAELTDRAKDAARRMGGDALLGVTVDDAATFRPNSGGTVGSLSLVAAVVRWK